MDKIYATYQNRLEELRRLVAHLPDDETTKAMRVQIACLDGAVEDMFNHYVYDKQETAEIICGLQCVIERLTREQQKAG